MSEPAGKPAESFDPYHKWLGIPPAERPVTYYRLLGLATFEDDGDVISDAADRQMAHVRNYQVGKHSELSQRILNELSTAKLCLLNPDKKRAYDAQLKAAQAKAAQAKAAPETPPAPAPKAATQTAQLPAKPAPASLSGNPVAAKAPAGGLPMPVILGGAGAVGVAVVGLVAFLFWPSGTPEVAQNTPTPGPTPISTPVDPATPSTPNTPANTTPDTTPTTPNTTAPNTTAPNTTPPDTTPVTPPVSPVTPPVVPVTPPVSPTTPTTPTVYPPLAPGELPRVISKLLDAPPGLVWTLPHANTVGSVAVTPDGRRAITSGAHRTIGVWDLETGRELQAMPGNEDMCWGVAISADGRRGVSGGFDSFVRVWDLDTGKMLWKLEGHSGRVVEVALTPDGKRVLSPGFDGSVRYWDAETGRALHSFRGHRNNVIAVAFTPDGKRAVSGGGMPFSSSSNQDRSLRVWNLETGEQEAELNGHALSIDAVAVSRDGRYALTGSIDRTAKLWDLKELKEVRTFTGHTQPIKSAKFSPDGEWVYTAATDDTARVWSLATGEELLRVPHRQCECLAVTADRRVILTGGPDSLCRVWRLPDLPDGSSFAGGPAVVRQPLAVTPTTPVTPQPTTPAPNPAPFNPELTPATPVAQAPAVKRSPVPDNAALGAARKTIKEVFADELKSRKQEDKAALARKLQREGMQTKDDEAARYALLDEAFNVACDLGDAQIAWQAAEGLDQYFEVDLIALKKNALSDAARQSRTPPRTIVQMYQALVELAVLREDHDPAAALVTAGIAAARKAKDEDAAASLQSRGKEVRDLRGEFGKIKAAREKLATSPDDAESNLLVGKYLCLVQNKWDEGMPLLVKGSDETYRDLAKQEQGQPRTTEARITLGDAWWAEAEKDRTAFKTGLQRRAAYWYEKAAPFATGLVRSRIEKRAAETPKLASTSGFGGFGPVSKQDQPPPVALNVGQPNNNNPPVAVPAGRGDRAVAEAVLRANGSVSIYNERGSYNHINNLQNLPPTEVRLHGVSLGNGQNSDADLAMLKGLAHLQNLSLLNSQYTDDGLANLSGLVGLTNLTIHVPRLSDEQLKVFSRMPNLKYVNLSGSGMTGAGLVVFSGALNLQSMDIRGADVSDAAISAMRPFPRLSRVELYGDQLTGANLHELSGLPQLRQLTLGGAKVGDAACQHLARLPQLTSLYLQSNAITDTGLSQLGHLQQLSTLSISPNQTGGERSQISDEGLTVLRNLRRLQSLTLTNLPQFTGKALSNLGPGGSLTYLHVAGCPNFKDASMMNLRQITNLQTIYFFETPITDVGVAHLKGLGLSSVQISGAPLTDASLQSLSTLPRLRSVYLYRTQITPATLEQFNQAVKQRAGNN